MTLKTDFRRPSGINNCVRSSATLVVDTAWTVARFAADIFCVGSCCLQASVRGSVKISNDVSMTFSAALGPGEFSAGNLGWHDDSPSYRRAGNHHYGKQKTNQQQPNPFVRSNKIQSALTNLQGPIRLVIHTFAMGRSWELVFLDFFVKSSSRSISSTSSREYSFPGSSTIAGMYASHSLIPP